MSELIDPICQNPSCGHPKSMHDTQFQECSAPSDHLSKNYGGEIGEQPFICPCSQFEDSASFDDPLQLPPLDPTIEEIQRAKRYTSLGQGEIDFPHNEAVIMMRSLLCRERQLCASLSTILDKDREIKNLQQCINHLSGGSAQGLLAYGKFLRQRTEK